ncbi:MAG: TIGR01212 family radical SAM protein [Clostridia bacterium]|nr:TIGR01212 family radical SAM protein [Clostridia bacterium]
MTKAGYSPIVMPADIDENIPEGTKANDAVKALALKKADAVIEKIRLEQPSLYSNAPVVIAADTVVSYENKILGKPKDKEECIQMLKMLRNNKHQVITGVAIKVINGKEDEFKDRNFSVVSDVEFGDYSDEFLDQYSDTAEPYDKAGAYAIQGTFGQFVKEFHGDYDNIVGFPWAEIEPYIKKALYRYRINNIDHYLKAKEGQKTIKLAIDGGFTCPNRDGSKGYGGCTFCSDSGSGEFASNINEQIQLLSQKWPKAEYMAYLQNHTNTYAPLDELKAKYENILSNEMIKGLVIGTRPDCLSDEIISYLAELNKETKLWLELGLQTVHDETAHAINRCYDTALFYERYNKLKEAGIKCVVHLILGLPGESKEMMLESIKKVAVLKPFGIKLHLLNIVKSSVLAKNYPIETYPFKDIDEYTDFIVEALRYIPPEVTVHRLTGDAPREILIHPLWSHEKRTILNQIQYKMDRDNIIQGDLLK